MRIAWKSQVPFFDHCRTGGVNIPHQTELSASLWNSRNFGDESSGGVNRLHKRASRADERNHLSAASQANQGAAVKLNLPLSPRADSR